MSFLSTGITSYGYGLKIVSSGWSFVSAVLGQMTISSISTVSISLEDFLPSILLLMVIIVAVVIVMVIWAVVVVVGGVSFIIKLSFMFEDNTSLSSLFNSDQMGDVILMDFLICLVTSLDFLNDLFKIGNYVMSKGNLILLPQPLLLKSDDLSADSLKFDNVVEEDDEEWICFLGSNSSSGIKKYWGSNSSDSGNTGDGVKIVGGVIGSGDEIESSEELKELLSVSSGN
ncbi:hypothetical protein Tco_0438651 [Tanacetum coccineum]